MKTSPREIPQNYGHAKFANICSHEIFRKGVIREIRKNKFPRNFQNAISENKFPRKFLNAKICDFNSSTDTLFFSAWWDRGGKMPPPRYLVIGSSRKLVFWHFISYNFLVLSLRQIECNIRTNLSPHLACSFPTVYLLYLPVAVSWVHSLRPFVARF